MIARLKAAEPSVILDMRRDEAAALVRMLMRAQDRIPKTEALDLQRMSSLLAGLRGALDGETVAVEVET